MTEKELISIGISFYLDNLNEKNNMEKEMINVVKECFHSWELLGFLSFSEKFALEKVHEYIISYDVFE